MDWLVRFLKSSIGAKAVVALTGLGLVLFVIVHTAGNLQIFFGPDVFNDYAHTLQSNTKLVWGARIGLLGAFLTHVVFTLRLVAINREARPVAYHAPRKWKTSTPMSRSMKWAGIALLLFVVFHILHFTVGVIQPAEFKANHLYPLMVDGRTVMVHDAYKMFIEGFKVWWITGLYIVANVALGMHLFHGATSMFQTMGLNHSKWTPIFKMVGPAVAGFVATGNIVMPLMVALGVLK